MTDETNAECGAWPEQDAIDAWLERHGIEVTRRQAIELKHAVTDPRLKIQRELDSLKIKILPWWRKDRLGWPITTIEGRPCKTVLRFVFLNIKKLWPVHPQRR